ncbi:Yippee/Mis18 [Syncephalis pseudoplumigaleata]|uniref:Protein yippee-like n=1 Tax=Syncephalis pseudoplumigaleata TaxID=1712513 RepID=A0A4P9Z0S2_9FUNG|nr:Yippee/Mis18 [Syncephalis pseudoplumigaleata]|eukprot:RKP25898.1 Yippee/Mis18 [Syncephalis pseudoplumigaleata]
MGLVLQVYLDDQKVYVCFKCNTHIALHSDIVSKAFQGRHGRAILFANAYNVTPGEKEDRMLITGEHTVADVHCNTCQTLLGWYYYYAAVGEERYKEGKYAIEKKLISKDPQWT